MANRTCLTWYLVSARKLPGCYPGTTCSALTRITRFAEQFPDEWILATLLQELTWSHFTLLLPLKDRLAREFYTEMCRVERSHPAAKDRWHAVRACCPGK
jgi:hypothetical protein